MNEGGVVALRQCIVNHLVGSGTTQQGEHVSRGANRPTKEERARWRHTWPMCPCVKLPQVDPGPCKARPSPRHGPRHSALAPKKRTLEHWACLTQRRAEDAVDCTRRLRIVQLARRSSHTDPAGRSQHSS
eukprot:168416-Chlamydomonas_euryale.AAC.4